MVTEMPMGWMLLAAARSRTVALLVSCLVAGLVMLGGSVQSARAITLDETFGGGRGFPETGGPGAVLSIDASTALPPAGSGTYTTLHDLVAREDSPNEIDPIGEDGNASFDGTGFSVEAPEPFAWQAGSGTLSVVRANDRAVACGSLRGELTVTTTHISVTFDRIDVTNACAVIVSGVNVVPKAASPLVPAAFLMATSTGPGVSGLVGVLALTTSQGTTPSITVSATSSLLTFPKSTTLTVTIAPNGANRALRLEQSFDGRSWTMANVATTDQNGTLKYPLQPRFNRFYRFVFVGGDGLAAGASNAVKVAVRFNVTMSPVHTATTVIRRGSSVRFTATAKPVVSYFQRPSIEFRLYHRSSTGWRLAKSKFVITDASGKASWKPTFAVRGEWYVRARAHPTYANTFSVLTPIARYSVR